jgi:hypothetical protein
MPFGGTNGMFPEQGCMTNNGNLMDLSDAVEHMKSMRISRAQFMEMFAAEEAAKTNGKTNGKKHPKGSWVEEATYETTINTMFWDGPICLWHIAHEGSHDFKNNFLMNVTTFLKKKYPENWEKALEWVNYNILKPVGDRDKLNDLIKRRRTQDYEYQCHDEPICSRCFAQACRKQPYGVGADGGVGIDYYEMGMTIIERIPQLFFIGTDNNRRMFEAKDILSLYKFKEKCLEYGFPFPPDMKKVEWENLIRRNIENATRVEPTEALRTGALEIEILTRWLELYVPNYLRRGDTDEDDVRVKKDERRVYFKWKALARHCTNSLTNTETEKIRSFITDESNCKYHDRKDGREWYRCRYSISFDKIDEEVIEKWEKIERENRL